MNGTELFVNLIFSSVGAGYLIYGKKQNKLVFLIDGIVLTVYPYFIHSELYTAIIGVFLAILPFLMKKMGWLF